MKKDKREPSHTKLSQRNVDSRGTKGMSESSSKNIWTCIFNLNQRADGGDMPRFSAPSVLIVVLIVDLPPFRDLAVMLNDALGGESSLKFAKLNALELLNILDACFSFLILSSCCWFSSSFFIFWYLWSNRSNSRALVLRCSSILDAILFFNESCSIFYF